MQLTVEALDALVHTVIVTIWTAALVALIVGAVALARQYHGAHRSVWHAEEIGHQPAHAAPVRPSRVDRATAAVASGWRELAAAHALLRGDTIHAA